MLSIEKNFCKTLSEEVVLFTEDGSPYYVSPAASRVLYNEAENNSLIEEVTGIVRMVSTLKLKLSYIMPLETAPLGSAIKCNVSKFGHGYKAMLIEDDVAKSRAVATEAGVHDTCYELKVVT